MTLDVDTFGTATIAICVFFLGGAIVNRLKPLRDYSIPESVVGGFICAIALALLYSFSGIEISFDISRRDLFLAYFFSALGLLSNVREIVAYRRPLAVIVVLASVFILVQNAAGMAIAAAFDHHPKLGIVAGSMALTEV